MRPVFAAQGGHKAFIALRQKKGLTLTKPDFVIRLMISDDLATSPAPPLTHNRFLYQLTPGERELAALVCRGWTNKEIAAELKRTEGSIKVQLSGIFEKLHVNNRTRLVVALRLSSLKNQT